MKRSLLTGLSLILISSFIVFGAASVLKKVALINDKTCVKCGVCYKKCPVKAISEIKKDGKVVQYLIDPKKCVSCGLCIKNCPVKAISWAQYDTAAKKMVIPDSAATTKKSVEATTKKDSSAKKKL